ncbi:MAG: insulinase family protein [Bacteroidetes bacterium]|jgi:zinc protease|nr:insulinase family protein [Bacteroidota bacterium]MBT3749576.1 insulinase family protein [Bacteroidota bacterium]MBT4398046.1 insulinase family protein [Bacteroidota bacterium]MBT4408663.1 insulinase family protein [Bacteroidota bacterium]MBT7093651.1 insulinase family protein [Bacteroidota bacterium]
MINFESHRLANGLKILVHPDNSTELAAVNLIYDVGSRDENPERTGFAHLFEHLMFGGSANIPDFDKPLQQAGGENNAFTNNDITNYYITLPHQNVETAFWLESDRMLELDFSQKNLDTQKKVVIEEFNQSYFNQPYGDVWLLLRPLVYNQHPYRWPTIGKEVAHIENAELKSVKEFFNRFYTPNNAILTVAGKVDPDNIFKLAEKWFDDIPQSSLSERQIIQEAPQKTPRKLEVHRPVPNDAIYVAFHMGKRCSSDFYQGDLISDILSNGNSSRLLRKLVKEEQKFTDVNAFITGDHDPGLFVVTGKPRPEVPIEEARDLLLHELNKLTKTIIGKEELNKVKNKVEANFSYGQTSILNKAMNLGLFTLLGDPNMVNTEVDKYRSIEAEELMEFAQNTFTENNSSILYYRSLNNGDK